MPDWSLKKFRSYSSQCLIDDRNVVAYHAFHESDKGPEGNSVVLHDRVYGCKEIAHALDVTQVLVVLVVCQEHILHLLEMDISASVRKWRVWVRMRNVFACEDWYVAVCSVYIFLYMADPIEWGKVSLSLS
jgi:hypothetical protein